MQKSKKTFVLLSLAHGSNDICWMMVPLLLPLIRRELHLTYTESGLLLSCFSVAFSVFSILSGHLGDIYKARRVLSFGFLFTAAIFPLLLLSQSYFQIIAVLVLAAIGISVFHPVGTALLSRSWQKGVSFGFFEATGCMGVLIMTLLFSSLVTSLGWRLTSLVLAAPSLPIGLAFLASHGNLEHSDSTARPKVDPAKSKSLGLFYLARMAQIFGGVAVGFFLPLFAVDVGGLSPEKASFFPLFIWVGAVPGMLVCGLLSDYYSPLKIIFVLVLINILAIFAITLPFPLLAIFVLLTVLGFSGPGTWPPQNVWLSQVTSEKTRGKTFGGLISLVNLAQAFSPLLFGFLADKWGLISAFRWAILPIAAGAVCLGRLVSKE